MTDAFAAPRFASSFAGSFFGWRFAFTARRLCRLSMRSCNSAPCKSFFFKLLLSLVFCLAAANDGLVGANNEKGETKQQETDAHLFENQRSEPANRAAAWGVCTSAATMAAAGTKKQQCETNFLTLLQSVGCLMNLRGPPESGGWPSAIKRAYLTVSVKLGAKALYSGAYWLWARTRPERKVPMRIARPSTVKVNLPFGNLR